ncbi:hypothetical protein [Halomonas elongata]|uniref:hypothetical protein n=1 Tax=Halomonas elongata TaxID=2746 RepID=UPI0023AEA39E|nr:hypothetical protein [Halomonas elongata]
MSDPKRYVATAGTVEEALAAIAKFPGMLNQAFRRWKRVRMVIEEEPERRSLDQNRLQRLWCKEAGQQGDMAAEEYRGQMKLHHGVPILRRDCPEFAEKYGRLVKWRAYEEKLEFMQEPFDFPITRLMTKAQKTEYLNKVYTDLTGRGIRLTDPELKGIGPDQYREVAA